jgi:hypothetical protein
MSRTDVMGTVYLLHFIDPATGKPAKYKHAGHYVGWSENLDARVKAHMDGTGARLVEVITNAGLSFTVVRTWPGTRALVRRIKNRHNASRICPECSPCPQPARKALAA